MTLVLNEEQLMLRDAAAGFLGDRATVAHLRALRDRDDEVGYEPAVWREMAGMGWTGIAIGEQYGGLGYGYTGLGVVLEQAGRHLSPSPLQAAVLVGATVITELASGAQKEQWLPAIAAGERIVTLALQERRHHAPLQTAMKATRVGDHYVLDGSKCLVLDAHVADAFIVVARLDGHHADHHGLSAFLVEAGSEGLQIERRSVVDSRNAGALILRDVQVPEACCLGAPGEAWPGLERALDMINIGLAAELLGLATEAFERTVAYLQERKQFGRVIGSFQGLQHRAAVLFAELELARSVVLDGLRAIDAGEELPLRASAAKAKLCQVAELATNEGIQLHGGIGMTDEYDIGFFIKRARVLQHLYGDSHYHLDRFAALSGF
ncbi:acyl-CoA dehydrogenase family protein [Pseudohaliea rubra]|uniref:Acyl-CoA dehydrogenase family protein n=1 Tax=Pseudohaliea rubra DSM 19751 TaxID=1265313 RepID=A0A095WVK3_9GAMM|nr:acyl-CoA dehydrogenase family protein [Pseudohaliea rubra]KGE02674.1 Acyl-CoA dehydrogenase family protein [Pseudohaliea rubra DSM 19751]